MNTRTYSVTIPAPKSRVFAYLAENQTQWLPEAERDATALALRAALANAQ